MSKRHGYVISGAAILCAGAILCHGRVFERSGTVLDSTKALLMSGGTLAYESSVTINSGKGDLAVVGFNKSITQLVSELSHIFNTKNIIYSGGTMAFITARTEGFIMRLTVIKLGNNIQTLVFKIQQSEGDFRASAKPPKQHMIKDIPSFPGSEPTFYAADDKSNAGLAVSQTTSDPASVRSFFTSQLASSGWTPAMPGYSAQNGPSMLVFNKEHEICCVMVDPSETAGKNRITLLHKQRGIE
ncbi:MAG: hypothetical protein PHR77_18595 [Kiritimatiellae bacterium]|nr:hypothetical protein [Kiritimatiellia bacterium]MDD5520400.1 hypothetical protein [Kiritimatiellia bacterium]